MRRPYLLALVVVFVAGALGPAAFAQSQATTGVIEGIVVDESGAPVPGVSVTLRNTGTNFERVVASDNDGRFRGLLLPLGPYRVTAALQGFATVVRDGVDLAVGQSVNLRLNLKVSAVQEEILVTGALPVVETTRAESSTLIDQNSIKGLPNNGRNFLDFARLTPGVAIVQGPDGDEISINGQKGISNNVSVDGADFNNPFFGEQRGGQRPPFTFNLDAVKEIVVVAEGANAEFGRASSGFVNVVTKSGTNETHGTAHLYLKDDSFSSRAKTGRPAPAPEFADKFPSNQQQFGFTLGGPLQKDKLFYFAALDVQRGRSTKQTDPSRIEQRVVDYFASVGSADENGSIDRTNDARVFLGKLDYQAAQNHLLTLRYNYTWSEQENGTFDVDSWGRSANSIEQDYSHAVTGSAISNLSPTMLNEFRFQWAKEFRPRPYNGPNVAGQSRPLPDTAFDFARGYRFGMPFFIPVEYYDQRIQLNNNFSWIRGRHSFKAGVEVNWVKSVQTFIGFANGRYIFGSTDGFLNYAGNPNYVECSDGSSSPIGACPPGASVTGPVLLYLQQAGVGGLSVEEAGTQNIPQTEPAIFIQDKWQPTNNLTIQYGIRWEAQIQASPITPASEVFYAPFIGTTREGVAFPSDGNIPSDKGMLQPRLGISWDPQGDGKTVVRLNGGIFYSRIPGLSLASSRSTNGSRGQTLFRNSALTGILGPVPAYPNLIPQSEIGAPFLPDVFVYDKDFKNPKTYAASIAVERELAPNLGALIQFNYAKAQNITRFLNGNDALLGDGVAPGPWGAGLAPGGANGINTLTVVSSNAKSLYRGLTLGLNKKWSDNYQFQVNYTISKDLSDDDNERDPFTFRYAKITDLAAEYGLSDRDQRHRLNGWLLWKSPGDVNVNLRYSYRSAQPLSLKADGTPANTPQDRINPDGSVTERNLGRKDNQFSSVDLRLSREFRLNDNVAIEPIVEVFNLFNAKNFKRPEITNLVFNFDGTVQSGLGDPRQAQFGVRLIW